MTKKKYLNITIVSLMIIVPILTCWKIILIKISHKETVGIVIKIENKLGSEAGYIGARYKFIVNNKIYYGYSKSMIQNKKVGYKFKVRYFSRFPSINIARIQEEIINDTTLFIEENDYFD